MEGLFGKNVTFAGNMLKLRDYVKFTHKIGKLLGKNVT